MTLCDLKYKFVTALLEKMSSSEKPLYCSRPVVFDEPLKEWIYNIIGKEASEKFVTDPHVTLAFSRMPVNWDDVTWAQMQSPTLDFELMIYIKNAEVTRLGDNGVIVLKFDNDKLQQEYKAFRSMGCSWDFPEYIPHVTLFANADDITEEEYKLLQAEPYYGLLNFNRPVITDLEIEE